MFFLIFFSFGLFCFIFFFVRRKTFRWKILFYFLLSLIYLSFSFSLSPIPVGTFPQFPQVFVVMIQWREWRMRTRMNNKKKSSLLKCYCNNEHCKKNYYCNDVVAYIPLFLTSCRKIRCAWSVELVMWHINNLSVGGAHPPAQRLNVETT